MSLIKTHSAPVLTDDHQQVGKLSWYVTSHLRQLSLASPLWIGFM